MKTKLYGFAAAFSIVLLSASPGSASTYDFSGIVPLSVTCTAPSYSNNCSVVTSTGTGSFDFLVALPGDTSGASGTFNVAGDLSYNMAAVQYGLVDVIDTRNDLIGSITLSSGLVTDWSLSLSHVCSPPHCIWRIHTSKEWDSFSYFGNALRDPIVLAGGTTPLPAALPLFASGLGALGLLGRRRKRKAAALAA